MSNEKISAFARISFVERYLHPVLLLNGGTYHTQSLPTAVSEGELTFITTSGHQVLIPQAESQKKRGYWGSWQKRDEELVYSFCHILIEQCHGDLRQVSLRIPLKVIEAIPGFFSLMRKLCYQLITDYYTLPYPEGKAPETYKEHLAYNQAKMKEGRDIKQPQTFDELLAYYPSAKAEWDQLNCSAGKATLKKRLKEKLNVTLNEILNERLEEVRNKQLKKPLKEAIIQPLKEVLKKSFKEPLKELLKKSLQEPLKKPFKELIKEPLEAVLIETLTKSLKDLIKHPSEEPLEELFEEAPEELIKEALFQFFIDLRVASRLMHFLLPLSQNDEVKCPLFPSVEEQFQTAASGAFIWEQGYHRIAPAIMTKDHRHPFYTTETEIQQLINHSIETIQPAQKFELSVTKNGYAPHPTTFRIETELTKVSYDDPEYAEKMELEEKQCIGEARQITLITECGGQQVTVTITHLSAHLSAKEEAIRKLSAQIAILKKQFYREHMRQLASHLQEKGQS